jgi:S-adenosylmethionine:tRNA ribosyltransferase-isomerase
MVWHTPGFSNLPRLLIPGDLVVVNTSGTLDAAADGHRADGRPVTVHFSTPLDDGCWLAELRDRDNQRTRVTDAEPAETITLPFFNRILTPSSARSRASSD